MIVHWSASRSRYITAVHNRSALQFVATRAVQLSVMPLGQQCSYSAVTAFANQSAVQLNFFLREYGTVVHCVQSQALVITTVFWSRDGSAVVSVYPRARGTSTR